jgi:hypothetical protein
VCFVVYKTNSEQERVILTTMYLADAKNTDTFGQSVQHKSCAKYPNLSTEKASNFSEVSERFPNFLSSFALNRNSFWDNQILFSFSRAGPINPF